MGSRIDLTVDDTFENATTRCSRCGRVVEHLLSVTGAESECRCGQEHLVDVK